MIDGTTLMIVGVAAQAAFPARIAVAALGLRLRGSGFLASIAFAPMPHPQPVQYATVSTIAAPVAPDR